MRFSKRSANILTLDNDLGEVELDYEPVNDDEVLVERVGNNLAVAYLVADNDGSCNPMKDSDCQGDLYTRPSRYAHSSVITDNNHEFMSALGLDSAGSIYPDRDITVNGVTQSIWDHAVACVWLALDEEQVGSQLLALNRWNYISLLDHQVDALESATPSSQMIRYLRRNHEKALREDLADVNGHHNDLVEARVTALYAQHWKEIAGPLVVPIDARQGNETTYSPTTWDGDINELPDGVWVGDKSVAENIGKGNRLNITICYEKELGKYMSGQQWWVKDRTHQIQAFDTHAKATQFVEATYSDRPFDIATAAYHYADGVLDEYSKWCNGEVFGCVLEIFECTEAEGEVWWTKCASDIGDQCWNFIGEDHAEESLKSEFFDPAVKRLKEASHAV